MVQVLATPVPLQVPPNTYMVTGTCDADNGGGVEGCSGLCSAAHTGTPLHPSKHNNAIMEYHSN